MVSGSGSVGGKVKYAIRVSPLSNRAVPYTKRKRYLSQDGLSCYVISCLVLRLQSSHQMWLSNLKPPSL